MKIKFISMKDMNLMQFSENQWNFNNISLKVHKKMNASKVPMMIL